MSDPIDVAVGERLRAFRRERGMSQQILASHLGVSFQQVQKYERGINRISASMMAHAAEALSCSVAELMGETPREPLSADAQQLAAAFLALPSDRERRVVMNLVKAMLSQAAA